MKHTKGIPLASDRRRVLATTGVLGGGMLAGCLGDDDEDPADDVDDVDDVPDQDDVDDVDDMDDVDDTDDGDDDDDDDQPVDIERHDVEMVTVRGPPLPADAQYNHRFGDNPAPHWIDEGFHRYEISQRSFYNNQIYPWLVADWDYQPGIIELEMNSDIFWWSGEQLNAEDWYSYLQLEDWADGGDDLDAFGEVIATEIVDEQTLRMSLADTWREDVVLQTVIVDERIETSRSWNQQWNEQFEDTGGDMDAVGDLRETLAEYTIGSDGDGGDEELSYQATAPFEFRLDGSIGEVGEDYWVLELVPEKNGSIRAFADEINFTRWRVEASEETDVRKQEAFAAQEQTNIGAWAFDDPEDELDFPTWAATYARADHGELFNWNFMGQVPPASDPFFRRAYSFATDATGWTQRPDWGIDDNVYDQPFLNDTIAEQFISTEVLESFTHYDRTVAKWDEAEEELLRGGYERNGDGNWIMIEDGPNQAAGEPIDFTTGTVSWGGDVGDLGSDWFADLAEWGIQTEVILEQEDDMPILAQYHGGVNPEESFETIFGEGNLGWGQTWNNDLDESIMAPEVGDADAPEEEWVEYDTRAMADRLAVTTEEGPYGNLVDQLAWVYNQVMPRYQVVVDLSGRLLNDDHWHYDTMEDAPDKWTRSPRERAAPTGLVSYVPEDER